MHISYSMHITVLVDISYLFVLLEISPAAPLLPLLSTADAYLKGLIRWLLIFKITIGYYSRVEGDYFGGLRL